MSFPICKSLITSIKLTSIAYKIRGLDYILHDLTLAHPYAHVTVLSLNLTIDLTTGAITESYSPLLFSLKLENLKSDIEDFGLRGLGLEETIMTYSIDPVKIFGEEDAKLFLLEKRFY